MSAEGWVAWRGHEAPPGVSVRTGAKRGVEALRAQAGSEGAPGGNAILSNRLQGVGGGAGQVGGHGDRGSGRSQSQEVGKH